MTKRRNKKIGGVKSAPTRVEGAPVAKPTPPAPPTSPAPPAGDVGLADVWANPSRASDWIAQEQRRAAAAPKPAPAPRPIPAPSAKRPSPFGQYEQPGLMEFLSEPLSTRGNIYMTRQAQEAYRAAQPTKSISTEDPRLANALQALLAQEHEERGQQIAEAQAAPPAQEQAELPGSAGETAAVAAPYEQIPKSEVPIGRAVGLLKGAGETLANKGGSLVPQTLAAKQAMHRDIEERIGKPSWWGERLANFGLNTATDLGDVVTMIPGIAAQIALPQQAPPGSEFETKAEQVRRQIKEGEAMGRQLVGGAAGGTLEMMENPLRSAEARPISTAATYIPFLRGLLNTARLAKESAAARRKPPLPPEVRTTTGLPEQPPPPPPEAPAPPSPTPNVPSLSAERGIERFFKNPMSYPLEEMPFDALQATAKKVSDAAYKVGLKDKAKVPVKLLDNYMRMLADGLYTGNPLVTAFVEDVARGDEKALDRLNAHVQEMSGQAVRELTGKKAAKPVAPAEAPPTEAPPTGPPQSPMELWTPPPLRPSEPPIPSDIAPPTATGEALYQWGEQPPEGPPVQAPAPPTSSFRGEVPEPSGDRELGRALTALREHEQRQAPPEAPPEAPTAPPSEAPVEARAPQPSQDQTLVRALSALQGPEEGAPREAPVAERKPEAPIFMTEKQAVLQGKPGMPEYRQPDLEAQYHPVTEEGLPETYKARQELFKVITDMARISDDPAKMAEFGPAIEQEQGLLDTYILGGDGKGGTWKGKYLANPAEFAKKYLAAVEKEYGKPLTNQQKAGLLETLDRQTIDPARNARTGLEVPGPQEYVSAVEVYKHPTSGKVSPMYPEEGMGKAERDVLEARKKAATRVEVSAAKAQAEADAMAAAHEDADKGLQQAQQRAADTFHELRGRADALSNAKEDARKSAAANRLAQAELNRLAPKVARAEERASSAQRAFDDAWRGGVKTPKVLELGRKAEQLRAEANKLQTELDEVKASAQKTAKRVKVDESRRATAQEEYDKQQSIHRQAAGQVKVAETIQRKAFTAREESAARAESLATKRETVESEPVKQTARRLQVTRMIPTLDGVPMDPAKLVPPEPLTASEVRAAYKEGYSRIAERYRRPSTMAGRLEEESVRVMKSAMPDIEDIYNLPREASEGMPARAFVDAVEAATAENPTMEIMTGETNKVEAQKKMAATALGLVQGAINGDTQPTSLPQGMRAAELARVMARAIREMPDLPESMRQKLLKFAYEIGGYVPLDPMVGAGTEANPMWVHPLASKAFEWRHLIENPNNQGWIRQINNMVKSNETAKSLKSGVNNLVPNLSQAALREGLDPATIFIQGVHLMHELGQWLREGDSAVSPVRAEALKQILRAGGMSTDFVSKEILALKNLSPAKKFRMGPLEAWIKDPATDLPVDKASIWFYQHGDSIMRIREAVRQFESRADSIAKLTPDTHFDLIPTRRTVVRISRNVNGEFFAQDPYALTKEARKPQRISTDDLMKLLGKDASRRATHLVGDYGDLTQFNSVMKNAGLDGLVSLFGAWKDTAWDKPGKPGLLTNTLFRSPYAVSTNSPPALAKAVQQETGLAMRRAFMVQGFLNKMRQEGTNGPLTLAFRNKPSSDQRIVINRVMSVVPPNVAPEDVEGRTEKYIEGLPLLQWGQIGPTSDMIGLMANLMAIPQVVREHGMVEEGKLTDFGKAVLEADAGGNFTNDQMMRLLDLGGGPLLEAVTMAKRNATREEIASRLAEAMFGGTKMGLIRSAMGYLADPGPEEHIRIPPGDLRDAFSKFSSRERTVTDDPRTTMPVLRWWVQQLLGKMWQVKNLNSANPRDIKSALHAYATELKKSAHATSQKAIDEEMRAMINRAPPSERDKVEQHAVEIAQSKRKLLSVIDATVVGEWSRYLDTWETLNGKRLPVAYKDFTIKGEEAPQAPAQE